MPLQCLVKDIDLTTFEAYEDRQWERRCESFWNAQMSMPTKNPVRVTPSAIRGAVSREASPMFLPDSDAFSGDSKIEGELRKRRKRRDQE